MKIPFFTLFLFISILSCQGQNTVVSYDNRSVVENDSDLTEIFQERKEENLIKEQFTVFVNPYLEGQITLNNETITFQRENTPENDILGRTWIQKSYSQERLNIKYKEIDYKLEFKDEYRFIIIDYNSQKQKLLIEYSKLPWVSYHE